MRFLITFVSIYSLMHAFFYFRTKVILPRHSPARGVFIVFLTAMVFAPITTRLLERSGHDVSARFMACLGYGWMGFLFISFWGLSLLLVLGFVFKAFQVTTGAPAADPTGKNPTVAVLVLAALIFVYGLFEAQNVTTERITVSTSKLPANIQRLKIAQISDVHLGLLVGSKRLEQILAKVRAEDPDVLVCTGDLVDGNIDRMDEIHVAINELNPRFGKYAVIGNHEYYAGLSRSIKFTESFGFEVLRNTVVNVQDVLQIAGVDDAAGGALIDEAALLASGQTGLFTLFLKHRPAVTPAALGLFDLQLSGHTHRGQVFPFRWLVHFVYPLQDGFYRLGKGSCLYTSRGSGTWGPPIRVLSPPEVTLIEVVRD
ncbi:metallophosphoesterase [Desulfoferrobacter suflitae]|uniref:metallophosphoesterase n=1 Tax=Desulfoferrobacter suflitae TaxID=2865782 RepID=UPI00216471C0|nr:metallophosphoesterase [Desulfoferrobacter suflitae]MCK8601429.1 metallophosphoesterase [Desulfoferrobacter suflitae]